MEMRMSMNISLFDHLTSFVNKQHTLQKKCYVKSIHMLYRKLVCHVCWSDNKTNAFHYYLSLHFFLLHFASSFSNENEEKNPKRIFEIHFRPFKVNIKSRK